MEHLDNSLTQERMQVLSIIILIQIMGLIVLIIQNFQKLINTPSEWYILLLDVICLFLLTISLILSRKKQFYWISSLFVIIVMVFASYFVILNLLPGFSLDFGYLIFVSAILMSNLLLSKPLDAALFSTISFLGIFLLGFINLQSSPAIFFGKNIIIIICILVCVIYSFLIKGDRNEIKKKSIQYLVEKEKVEKMKLQEERYHSMLAHYLKNDMQQIILKLDLEMKNETASQNFPKETVNYVKNIAIHSTKKIEVVNKIFAILQSSNNKKFFERYNILRIIQEVIKEISLNSFSFKSVFLIPESLNVEIIADEYLKDLYFQIFLFVSQTKGNVYIWGSRDCTDLCIIIQEGNSRPIPEDICYKLSAKITEDWVSQGSYIGLSLASVISHYYGGYLNVLPGIERGNEFHIYIPKQLFQ